MAKFKNVPPRTRPRIGELAIVYRRQFGRYPEGMLKDKIESDIKLFGKCECHEKCKEPLAGHCEWDHKYLYCSMREGDKIDWRPVTKAHHSRKTQTQDVANAAKLKRTAKKYNPEALDGYEPEQGEKTKAKWGKQSFPPRPEGYEHQWAKRKFGQ